MRGRADNGGPERRPVNGWALFQTLATDIQEPLLGIVDDMIAGLSGPIGQVLRVGIAVMIGWLMLKASLQGGNANPLSDLEGKLILGGAVYLIASQAANYHQWVSNLFLTQLGQEVSTLVSGGGQAINGQVFDNIWNTAYVAGLAVYRELSWTDFGLQILIVVYWLVALVAIVVGFAIWLISYIILALLVGTGPIFVACAAFPPLRSLFERWIGAMIGCVVLQVFVVVLLTLLTKTETVMIGQIASGGSGNATAQLQLLLGGLALFLVCGFVLMHLPGAAQSVAGGLSFHAGSIVRGGTQTASAAVAGSHAAVAAGGRAVSAGIRSAAGRVAPGRSLSSS